MLDADEILNASILIADARQANIALLAQILGDAGYTRVASTMEPRNVAAMHAAQRYALIVLDLHMPEMDGLRVLDALRQASPDGPLPVLAATSQADLKPGALRAGAWDCVSQPYDALEVRTRVRNLLEVHLLRKKLAAANDSLELKVAERTAELRESEARFQRYTELTSDWYWEQDAQGKLTKFSGPVMEMLGGGTGADGEPGVRALLQAKIAARRPFLDFVYTRSDPAGMVQYLQISGEPMFDATSRFIGYRGIGMDITERMRPDEQQSRFRSAMDVIDQGICLVDQASMRLLDVNQTVCRMVGYSREEMLALDLDSIGIAVRSHQATLFEAVVAGGDGHRQMVTLRRKGGSTLAAAIDWRGLQVVGHWIMVGVVSADSELAG